MSNDDVVVAVLPDRAATAAAVTDLRHEHLGGERLAAALGTPERHLTEIDADAVWARSVVTGILIGIPFGSLATLGLVALGTALAGAGAGDGVVPGLLAGGFLGIVFGGAFGVGRANRRIEEAELWSEVPLESDEVLVVALAHDRPDQVREVFRRHGAREPELHTELAA